MGEYISTEILIIIGSLIGSFVLLNIIFKFISMPRVIKVLLIGAALVGNGYLIFQYFENNDADYKELNTKNYVIGTVVTTGSSVNKMKVNISSGNIKNKTATKDLVVNTSGALIKEKAESGSGSGSSVISIKDIKQGDKVKVYCKENTIESEDSVLNATIILKAK